MVEISSLKRICEHTVYYFCHYTRFCRCCQSGEYSFWILQWDYFPWSLTIIMLETDQNLPRPVFGKNMSEKSLRSLFQSKKASTPLFFSLKKLLPPFYPKNGPCPYYFRQKYFVLTIKLFSKLSTHSHFWSGTVRKGNFNTLFIYHLYQNEIPLFVKLMVVLNQTKTSNVTPSSVWYPLHHVWLTAKGLADKIHLKHGWSLLRFFFIFWRISSTSMIWHFLTETHELRVDMPTHVLFWVFICHILW